MLNPGEFTLNTEQQEAVEYNGGPLLVIAGAGTGKTYVLVEKIKHIIEKKLAKPEEILALTFTEKASREMEDRVDKAVPYGYFQLQISTFHAFAESILRNEASQIGLNPGYRLLTEAENILFLRNNLFMFDMTYFRPLGNPNKFLSSLLQHFSRLKDEDVGPEEYLKWAKKNTDVPKDEREKNTELSKAYDLYQKIKIKEGYFDFSDLIYYTLLLFRKRRNVLEKYQKQFKYILVDEFQDTNIAQYQLVKLLFPQTISPRLTVVGDDSQAIYKFRGASVSNLLSFMKDYPKSKQITLRKNYRSLQPILDASYKLIKHNDPDTLEAQLGISKNLIAQRKLLPQSPKEHVEFFLGENVQKEADFVADEILKLKKNEKSYSFSDFAILLRANNYAEPFIRALLQRGIPYQFWGPGMLFKQPEVRDLIAYFNTLVNLEDSASFYRVLSMEVFDIDHMDISYLLSFAKRINSSLFNAVEIVLGLFDQDLYQKDFAVYRNYLPRIRPHSKQALITIYQMIKRHLGLVKKETAGQILFYFLEDTKYIVRLLNYKTEKEERKALNVSKFFAKLKNYETEHEDASVFAVVDYLGMSMELGESPLVAETDIYLFDAVNLITVHGTKGLEFPVVFLVNLVQGRFPTYERREQIPIPQELIKEILPEGDYHILEERRLFYVGLTRSMNKVYFTASRLYGEGKRERKLSPFVIETLGEDVVKKKLGVQSAQKAQLSIFDFKKTEEKIIKRDLPLRHLSYSQIQTFLMCPLRYKLQYLLKIPQPEVEATSFGATIHTSLEQFYREFKLDQTIGLKKLLDIYKSSWIPVGYSSQVQQEKTKRVGEQMLKRYFEKLHDPKARILDLEKFFTLKIDDISIVGVLDRVDEKENGGLEIIDYKTGKMIQEKEVVTNLQLSIYLLAATNKQLYNRRPEQVDLTFYFLQETKPLTTKKNAEDIELIKTRLREVIEKIKNTDFSSPELQACNRCYYCKMFSDLSL